MYICTCSRKEIGNERYPGTCRSRRLLPGDRPPAGAGIRVELDDAPEQFEDQALGPIVQTPAEQCGDLLLKDRDGNWTYQFAVTVDDMNDAVDLIVRGSICSHQPDGRSNWPGCSDAHRRLSSITIRSSSNPTARNSVKRAAIRASASCAPPASLPPP